MKTVLIFTFTFTTLLSIGTSEKLTHHRKRGAYGSGNYDLNYAQSSWRGSHVPLQKSQLYSSSLDDILPLQQGNPLDVDFKVTLPSYSPQYSHIASNVPSVPVVSNSIDKPVDEPQEYIPPQSVGTAVIPQMPPPATPVNAVAANVPGNNGAVFLGSGSLGVVDLGNGAYALGSGALGYSAMRSNPRPSIKSPLFPPLSASPNLIPAAIPSSIPPPANPLPSYQPIAMPVDYNHPLVNFLQPQPPPDPNGYEYLPPNRVGFGSPIARLPRPKTTQAFATPTALQVQQPPLPQPTPQLSFPPMPPQPIFGQPPLQTNFQLLQDSQAILSQSSSFGQKLPSLYSQDTTIGKK